MSFCVRPGQRLPQATLAEMHLGEVRPLLVESLFAGKRCLVVGVPGAFTPTCSDKHLPEFVQMADQLRRSGFDEILVITASDPYACAAWAGEIDPQGKLRIVSDGNLEFARKAGLTSQEQAHFLGERSKRYLMIVRDAVIERLSVEDNVVNVTCTRARSVELAI